MAETKETKTVKKPSTATTKKAEVKKATPVKENNKTASKKVQKEKAKILGNTKNFGIAINRNVFVAPRKVKLVIDLIRGKNIKEALAILMFTRKAASKPITDTLKSAIANAVKNSKLKESKLYVSECYVTEGIVIKRTFARARGSADIIRKRKSHITVCVKERD